MRTLFLLFSLALVAPACSPSGPLDFDDDDATGDDDDVTGDDDDVADDDDATGDDDDMGPCESGICELTVVAAAAECNMLPEPDPMPEGGVLASSPAPGQVTVQHFDHDMGCCPEIRVNGLAYMNDQRIDAEFELYDDLCDCICTLDVQYTLGEVPPGTWTVFGHTVEVE
jgi:hypothetical protein